VSERWEKHPQANLAETSAEMQTRMTPQVAMMTGALMGAVMRSEFPLVVAGINPEMDGEDYMNSFVVTLFSGKKIRVTVEDE